MDTVLDALVRADSLRASDAHLDAAAMPLDALCDHFSIPTHDRHTAGGDALLTVYVFLRLLRRAKRVNRATLGSIAERFSEH